MFKIMTKLFVYLSSALLLLGCTSKSIQFCSWETLAYTELPKEVKAVVFDSVSTELNTPKRYRWVTQQDVIMPWIYTTEVVRKADGKTFEIDINYGDRYIILEDSLYIPQHYNIYKADSTSYTFSRYELN